MLGLQEMEKVAPGVAAAAAAAAADATGADATGAAVVAVAVVRRPFEGNYVASAIDMTSRLMATYLR